MCTVTFIPRKSGYRLGMNRDEQRTRPSGLPPTRHYYPNGATVICPTEPTGGTWISLNDSGISLALVNWYSVPARVTGMKVSRGEVVRRLAAIRDPRELKRGMREIPLDRINPFRLIVVLPELREIVELRWDLVALRRLALPWKAQQWISSGFNEPAAQRSRSAVFSKKTKESDFGSHLWLRRLHSSHLPEAGPFSTCMHREEAVTVSYTEITISDDRGAIQYRGSSPCAFRNGSARIWRRSFPLKAP